MIYDFSEIYEKMREYGNEGSANRPMEKKGHAQKRYEASLLEEKNELEELLEMITQEENLRKQGLSSEAEKIGKIWRSKMEAHTKKMGNELTVMQSTKKRIFDRTILPSEGGILTENGYIILKAAQGTEYEFYKALSRETSITGLADSSEEITRAIIGSYFGENKAYYSIYEKKTGCFIGYVAVEDLRETVWEIAIELHAQYRNMGFGYSAVTLLLDAFCSLTGEHTYMSRVDPGNYASQALMRKIGAVPDRVDEYMLHGEALREFKKRETAFIDDLWLRTANEFQVDPVDLLGQILVYRIEWRKKSSSAYASYDDGYDAVYDDGDYDWDRYQKDSDYANGDRRCSGRLG